LKDIWERADLSLVSACIYCSDSVCSSRFIQTQRGYLQSVRSTQMVICYISADGQQHPLTLPCCHLEYGWTRSCSKCHTQDCRQMSTQALMPAGDSSPLRETKKSGPCPVTRHGQMWGTALPTASGSISQEKPLAGTRKPFLCSS